MTFLPPLIGASPLGRRRSVGRTSVRRSPSARKRPESGEFPLRIPAARVHIRAAIR